MPYHLLKALAHKSREKFGPEPKPSFSPSFSPSFGKLSFSSSLNPSFDDKRIMRLPIVIFAILFIFVFAIWFYSLSLLLKHWKELSPLIKVICVMCLLLPYGSIITVVLIKATIKT